MYDEKSTNINQELNIKPLLFHESVQTTILCHSDSSTRINNYIETELLPIRDRVNICYSI